MNSIGIDSQGKLHEQNPTTLDRPCTTVNYTNLDVLKWSVIGSPPPGVSGAPDAAVVPVAMRAAYQTYHSSWNLFGCSSNLGSDSTSAVMFPFGKVTYDYRWRAINADTLRQDLGLRPVPMLIEKREL